MKMTIDQTTFTQSLMHMLKGNLGGGILAMPISVAHCGLIYGIVGLTLLCLLAAYCVHLLVCSSQHLEHKMRWKRMDYAELIRGSFWAGPTCAQSMSTFVFMATNTILVVSQIGICCVYLVFVVDNVHQILKENHELYLPHIYLFLAFFPIALLLSCIKTLKRLAIASSIANVLQIFGMLIIIQYLFRNIPEKWNSEVVYYKPLSEIALGIGSAMFSFEGISVCLPVYTRMKHPQQMNSPCGIINICFLLVFLINFAIGGMGYLEFGDRARASVTLNLPKEPLYDSVRAMYAAALGLTYPLQLYVPADILWKWAQVKLNVTEKTSLSRRNRYEYTCRTFLVVVTFVIAICVPKLNLMMDLVGSITGTALSLILPPLIHLMAFWNDTSGATKAAIILVDGAIMGVGIFASLTGTYFSLLGILTTLSNPFKY